MFGQKTAFDYAIGSLALLFVLAQVYLLLQYWSVLPDRLPTHYNFSGQPDAYGGKWSLLLILGISASLFVLMTVVALRPQVMNLPVSVTAENQEMVYGTAIRFVHLLRLLMGALFFYLLWGTIQVGLGKQTQLDNRFLFVLLGTLAVLLLWFLIRVSRK